MLLAALVSPAEQTLSRPHDELPKLENQRQKLRSVLASRVCDNTKLKRLGLPLTIKLRMPPVPVLKTALCVCTSLCLWISASSLDVCDAYSSEKQGRHHHPEACYPCLEACSYPVPLNGSV